MSKKKTQSQKKRKRLEQFPRETPALSFTFCVQGAHDARLLAPASRIDIKRRC